MSNISDRKNRVALRRFFEFRSITCAWHSSRNLTPSSKYLCRAHRQTPCSNLRVLSVDPGAHPKTQTFSHLHFHPPLLVAWHLHPQIWFCLQNSLYPTTQYGNTEKISNHHHNAPHSSVSCYEKNSVYVFPAVVCRNQLQWFEVSLLCSQFSNTRGLASKRGFKHCGNASSTA